MKVNNFRNISGSILVIMSDNRGIVSNIENCEYNTLCALINYNYCKTYGYGFKYFIPHNNGDYFLLNSVSLSGAVRYTSWNKIISTIKAIQYYPQYEYIVYIDSDCIFNNLGISLTDYCKNINVISGVDGDKANILFMNDRPFEVYKPCAGFYIIKNSFDSLNFLIDWFNIDRNDCNLFHPYEQKALYSIFDKSGEIVLIDDYMFVRYGEGQFLRHIGTHESQNRIPFFKSKVAELGLDNELLLSGINKQIIKYDINDII